MQIVNKYQSIKAEESKIKNKKDTSRKDPQVIPVEEIGLPNIDIDKYYQEEVDKMAFSNDVVHKEALEIEEHMLLYLDAAS